MHSNSFSSSQRQTCEYNVIGSRVEIHIVVLFLMNRCIQVHFTYRSIKQLRVMFVQMNEKNSR